MTPNQVSEIDGVRVTKTKSITDSRGTFIKFNPVQEFDFTLNSVAISTNSQCGTIRGIHFQVEPYAEEKLVTCVKGSIFDVIVDLRPNSNTFGKWASIELSAVNAMQAYLPKGIAHGFQTLASNSIIHYCLSADYSPESAYSIDPFGDLQIDWPLQVVSISERDKRGVSLAYAAQKYAKSLKN